MAENTIGTVPEFTTDETVEGTEGTEQVVETTEATTELTEETPVVEEEKETPVEPASTETPIDKSENETKLERQVQGLLNEIKILRGKSRNLTPQEQKIIVANEQKIDELQDVNPDDVKVIDKILRAKGYMTRPEAEAMTYKAVEQDELSKFLEKFPEYKPENDSNDLNWSALMREYGEFAKPGDPRKIGYLLEKARKSIVIPVSDRNIPEKKQAIKTASVGSGGKQRPTSSKTVDPRLAELMQQHMQGWDDDEILQMKNKLIE